MADYNSTYTGAQIDANLGKAATATQPGDLGTAAFTASTAYATAAQGTLAGTAVQPGANANVLGSGSATDNFVLTANGAGGVAWEAASGGGGTPGGTDTQVQFNDGGAFGGDSGFTFDKTNNTLGLGGGTITASDPIIDMAQTWNNAAVTFTALKANVTDTASAAGSLLMDLQVGGVSQFSVTKGAGGVVFEQGSAAGRTKLTLPQFSEISVNNGRLGISAGSNMRLWLEDGVTVFGGGKIGFSAGALSTGSSGATDVSLARDAANTLAQRNGVNAQTSRIYGTFTDASNYRRLAQTMSTAGVAEIKPEGAGTGATGNVLHISGLPTSNPGPGILWNNAGTPAIGT